MELDQRSEQILTTIIEQYIQNAEPVGSRNLAKVAGVDLSAATIRNVMSDLTSLGLIHQLHTSAGRVPTDEGYRYYVDAIQKQNKCHATYSPTKFTGGKKAQSIEGILQAITEELVQSTNCTSVILSPQANKSQFKKIDFIPLGQTQVLVVLVTQTGMVKNRILNLKHCPEPETLEKMAKLLQELFAKMTFSQIQEKLMGVLSSEDTGLTAQAIRLGKKAFNLDQENEDIYLSGESKLCTFPDFGLAGELAGIFQVLEEKSPISGFLHQATNGDGVQVAIGHENTVRELGHCSILAMGYGNAGIRLGSIGVIGPTRMNYPKVINALDYSSQKLSFALSQFLDEY